MAITEREVILPRKKQGSDGWGTSGLASSPYSKPAPRPPCFLINHPWRPENVGCEGKIKMIFKTGLPHPYSCVLSHDPVDCSPPGSSVHGISQARILEWVAISFSRGSSGPRDRTHISHISCNDRWILYQ